MQDYDLNFSEESPQSSLKMDLTLLKNKLRDYDDMRNHVHISCFLPALALVDCSISFTTVHKLLYFIFSNLARKCRGLFENEGCKSRYMLKISEIYANLHLCPASDLGPQALSTDGLPKPEDVCNGRLISLGDATTYVVYICICLVGNTIFISYYRL